MDASIIAIGDEILIGRTMDTNSNWIAKQLDALGITVNQILVIKDDEKCIHEALDNTIINNNLIILTGGLGPTGDDITKTALSEYFKVELEFNERVFENIKQLLATRGRKISPTNRAQAEILHGSIPLLNKLGTAPGLWIEYQEKIVVALPGVPFEMKALVTNEVIPKIKNHFTLSATVHKHINVVGIPESDLSDKLTDFENELPENIKIAYLPNFGIIKIRLTIRGNDDPSLDEEINTLTNKLTTLIPEFIFGYDEETLPSAIGNILKEKKLTISTAESCTGGEIAHMITTVPGSSSYFMGSIVAYSNSLKENLLMVNKSSLEKYGAVSKEVVVEMVNGVLKRTGSDYAIAVTGIAGPDGGTKEKPVGTTWIAVGNKSNVVVNHFRFGNKREQHTRLTAITALNLLRKEVIG